VAAQPRVRRNIDSLTPQELADYEHGISKLLEISANDPQSIDGYTYFEQLHDGELGPCEHKNDTFLPWHRAHLFLFEEALRRSDPPRTETITVPYWDWSALPSGRRYPEAFENESSVLFHEFRNDTPICRIAGERDCDSLPFPRVELESRVLGIERWSTREASQSSLVSFGGHEGGEQDCSSQFGLGFGALEQPAHNTMHDAYVGGDMAQPPFAALDPIFFSFHCYIDLLWAQWQESFETDTDLDARLCGLYTDREHSPGHRFRVRDTLDTETQLGYIYEYAPGEQAPAVSTLEATPGFPAHPAFDFAVSARKQPELVRTLDVTIPASFEGAHLLLTGVNVMTPFSYSADVYLTHPGEELRFEDRDFRATHLADLLYFWRAHHGDGRRRTHDLTVDLGPALRSVANGRAGEHWRVSVALGASDTKPRHHHGDHQHGHGSAVDDAAVRAEIMDFDELTLTVY
jgi:hypothetical protein